MTGSIAKNDLLDQGESRLRLDSYDAVARRITPADRGLLHELTISVLWPHRDHDLDLFISLGQGFLAIDEIGRAMGAAMYFPMGEDFAMFGMMATAPRLQTQGAGRWLLSRIMSECAGRDLRLSATRAAYRLYESEGFVPVGTIRQHQGIARAITLPPPVAGIVVRPLEMADTDAVLALDRHAYGADRRAVLAALLQLSQGVVAMRGDQAVGYALMRPFGRGKVIGPVIAEDEATAMQMVAPFIDANPGELLRLDLPVESPRFIAFLTGAGMALYGTVTEMRIGPQRRADKGPVLYGLASHSLG